MKKPETPARIIILLIRTFSVLMIAGGIVRIFAGENTFALFGIGQLWIEEPYALYVYKILGAFVIFTGASVYAVFGDPVRYRKILLLWAYLLLMTGGVMLASGLVLNIPWIFSLPDYLFVFTLAALIFGVRNKINS